MALELVDVVAIASWVLQDLVLKVFRHVLLIALSDSHDLFTKRLELFLVLGALLRSSCCLASSC